LEKSPTVLVKEPQLTLSQFVRRASKSARLTVIAAFLMIDDRKLSAAILIHRSARFLD
jgi:hypothetical protein